MTMSSEATAVVARCVSGFRGVDLITLDAVAEHHRRVDRKYVVTAESFERFVAQLGEGWLVLDIDGRRSFDYCTTYLDDAALTSFNDHIKGRRHRFKVRVRQYGGGADDVLEVKLKTGRGLTDKHRFIRERGGDTLTPNELQWLGMELNFEALTQFRTVDVLTLRPTLEVRYQRTTLVHPLAGERVTIDVDLRVSADGQIERPIGDAVIVEAKGARSRGFASEAMRAARCRDLSFSKYCVGVASVRPGLDHRMRDEALRRIGRI